MVTTPDEKLTVARSKEPIMTTMTVTKDLYTITIRELRHKSFLKIRICGKTP